MTTSVTDEMVEAAWVEFHRSHKGLGRETDLHRVRRCLEAALRSQGKVAEVAENRGLQTGLALGWKLGQDNNTDTFNSVSATYDREAREMRQEQCPTANTGKVVSVEKLKALQPYWCDWNDQALDEETDPEGSLKSFPTTSIVYKYEDLTAIIGEGD